MRYDEMLRLGFERINVDDDEYWDRYGNHCFYMYKYLNSNMCIEWHPEKKVMELIYYVGDKVRYKRAISHEEVRTACQALELDRALNN